MTSDETKQAYLDSIQMELKLDILQIQNANLSRDDALDRTGKELSLMEAMLPELKTLNYTRDWAKHYRETVQRYQATEARFEAMKRDTVGAFSQADYEDVLFDAVSLRKINEATIQYVERVGTSPRKKGFLVILVQFAFYFVLGAIIIRSCSG